MRSLSSSISYALGLACALCAHGTILAIRAVKRGQRGKAACWLRAYTPGLRADFYPSSGGEIVKQLFEILRREILKKILIDLDHRGIAASAETLDLNPRKLAVGSDSSRPANPPLKNCLDRVRPGKHTRSRAAHLDMEFANR